MEFLLVVLLTVVYFKGVRLKYARTPITSPFLKRKRNIFAKKKTSIEEVSSLGVGTWRWLLRGTVKEARINVGGELGSIFQGSRL